MSGEELGWSGERAKSFPKEGSLSPFLVLAVKKKGGRGGLVWLEGRDVDSIQIRLGPGRVHFRPTRADGPPQVADGPPLILSFSDALPTNPPDGPPNNPDGPPLQVYVRLGRRAWPLAHSPPSLSPPDSLI